MERPVPHVAVPPIANDDVAQVFELTGVDNATGALHVVVHDDRAVWTCLVESCDMTVLAQNVVQLLPCVVGHVVTKAPSHSDRGQGKETLFVFAVAIPQLIHQPVKNKQLII